MAIVYICSAAHENTYVWQWFIYVVRLMKILMYGNCLSVSEEKIKMWKVNRQTTDVKWCQKMPKAHMAFENTSIEYEPTLNMTLSLP
jgi:hypothetical protein